MDSEGTLRLEEPLIHALVHGRRRLSMSSGPSGIDVAGGRIPYEELGDVREAETGLLLSRLGWTRVRLTGGGQVAEMVCPKSAALAFVGGVSRVVVPLLRKRLSSAVAMVASVEEKIGEVYRPDRYVRASQRRALIGSVGGKLKGAVGSLQVLSKHALLPRNDRHAACRTIDRGRACRDKLAAEARTRHNEAFVANAALKHEEFFRSVESKPLTDEQARTALVFEDANLAIAAAGSGKSSCIVAKIGFALLSRMFRDDEVLALAYNKAAAAQLKDRVSAKLGARLGRPVDVECRTFHSFGLAIAAKARGEAYRPKVFKEEDGEEGSLIKRVIDGLMGQERFRNAVARWMLECPGGEPQPFAAGANIDECERLYEEACRNVIEGLKAGVHRRGRFEGSIPTFDPDVRVRSMEERCIANWLVLRGVKFEYEKPDWKGGERLGIPNGRPYKPDFTYAGTINAVGRRAPCRVVHEHFALDAQGRAPLWFGNNDYVGWVARKREMFRLMRRISPDTVLIETTSAQYRDGTLLQHLEEQLARYGVAVGEPRKEVSDAAVQSFRQAGRLERLIIDFVQTFKSSGLSDAKLAERIARSPNPRRAALFCDVARQVHDAYNAELRRIDRIDYTDMLRDAEHALRTGAVRTQAKLILVDEFQDISLLRAQLVKAVLDQDPDGSVVFCVGDDWQTINRFGGSDIEVFKGASRFFGRELAEVRLNRTFRCPQGIADVARELVMRNGDQIDKEVVAGDPAVTGTVRVVEHGPDARDRRDALMAQLEEIVQCAEDGATPSVYILRRTQRGAGVPDGMDDDFLKWATWHFRDRLEIACKSVHGSKGLEADHVIIVGAESGRGGFPDDRPQEWLMDLVLPRLVDPVAEERRLFYVGLTRAMKRVTVLVDATRPSEFVLDLGEIGARSDAIEWLRMTDAARIACPRCTKGSLIADAKGGTACSRGRTCGHRQR